MMKQVLEYLGNKCNVSLGCLKNYITVLIKTMKQNKVTKKALGRNWEDDIRSIKELGR